MDHTGKPTPPRHFRLPFRVGDDGHFETLDQDSAEDVIQCLMVVARCPIGARTELPQFGIPELEFQRDIPLVALLHALYTWEPRAVSVIRAIIEDLTDVQKWDVNVDAHLPNDRPLEVFEVV